MNFAGPAESCSRSTALLACSKEQARICLEFLLARPSLSLRTPCPLSILGGPAQSQPSPPRKMRTEAIFWHFLGTNQ